MGPCAAAFRAYRGWNEEFWPQRPSWDPAAVLVAVRGSGPYFEEEAMGHNTADPVDGSNAWVSDASSSSPGAQSYLRFVDEASGPGIVGQVIDDLVCARSAFNAVPQSAGRAFLKATEPRATAVVEKAGKAARRAEMAGEKAARRAEHAAHCCLRFEWSCCIPR